jgi:hypothetical protein
MIDKILTRKEAKVLGLKKYKSSTTCKAGHKMPEVM